MYGIIVEGIRFFVVAHFGDDMWHKVLEKAGISSADYSTHERYSERLIPTMLSTLTELSGLPFEDIGILAGKYFIHFMCKYGYDSLLRVLGRTFGDFLRGLDNLHEYFRFSYPKIRPPSFTCTHETLNSIEIHYRSRRSGYISYVMGQLIEIANLFYDVDIEIQIVRREERKGVVFTVMRLHFDNKEFALNKQLRERVQALNEFLPVESSNFLNMFPFFIVFNKKMEVLLAGKALRYIMPDILANRAIFELFDLKRPFVSFTWEGVKHHLNNIFEMESLMPVKRKASNTAISFKVNDVLEDKINIPDNVEHAEAEAREQTSEVRENADDELEDFPGQPLKLKGQMLHVRHSEVFIYLATVVVETLDQMFQTGLYINDYSLSDCNKDMIMASIQQSDSLKELLKGEKEKSKMLVNSLKQIDIARKRTKELLSQMMPPSVAKELLAGREPSTICESYAAATICFAKVYKFAEVSIDLSAMAVVTLLNQVFSRLDEVIAKHGIYKVETIGESYMICCGAPIPNDYHTEHIADTVLAFIHALTNFKEETKGKIVKIKMGMHSGAVVGGVVGMKAPRFCLFGDTVNCASRMESHNEVPMSTMISINSKEMLEMQAPKRFEFKDRGELQIKGKGEMRVYGLLNKKGDPRYLTDPIVEDETEDVLDETKDDLFTPVEDIESQLSSVSRISVQDLYSSAQGSSNTSSRIGKKRRARKGSPSADGRLSVVSSPGMSRGSSASDDDNQDQPLVDAHARSTANTIQVKMRNVAQLDEDGEVGGNRRNVNTLSPTRESSAKLGVGGLPDVDEPELEGIDDEPECNQDNERSPTPDHAEHILQSAAAINGVIDVKRRKGQPLSPEPEVEAVLGRSKRGSSNRPSKLGAAGKIIQNGGIDAASLPAISAGKGRNVVNMSNIGQDIDESAGTPTSRKQLRGRQALEVTTVGKRDAAGRRQSIVKQDNVFHDVDDQQNPIYVANASNTQQQLSSESVHSSHLSERNVSEITTTTITTTTATKSVERIKAQQITKNQSLRSTVNVATASDVSLASAAASLSSNTPVAVAKPKMETAAEKRLPAPQSQKPKAASDVSVAETNRNPVNEDEIKQKKQNIGALQDRLEKAKAQYSSKEAKPDKERLTVAARSFEAEKTEQSASLVSPGKVPPKQQPKLASTPATASSNLQSAKPKAKQAEPTTTQEPAKPVSSKSLGQQDGKLQAASNSSSLKIEKKYEPKQDSVEEASWNANEKAVVQKHAMPRVDTLTIPKQPSIEETEDLHNLQAKAVATKASGKEAKAALGDKFAQLENGLVEHAVVATATSTKLAVKVDGKRAKRMPSLEKQMSISSDDECLQAVAPSVRKFGVTSQSPIPEHPIEEEETLTIELKETRRQSVEQTANHVESDSAHSKLVQKSALTAKNPTAKVETKKSKKRKSLEPPDAVDAMAVEHRRSSIVAQQTSAASETTDNGGVVYLVAKAESVGQGGILITAVDEVSQGCTCGAPKIKNNSIRPRSDVCAIS